MAGLAPVICVGDRMKEKKKVPALKYYLISVTSIAVFILIWYLASNVFHVFRYNMLPGPDKVFSGFVYKLTNKMPDGNTLLGHIKASLIVVITGYVIGVTAGIPTGVLMAWYRPVDHMVRPVFDFLRTIPGVAWIPVVTVWLGIGLPAKAAIIFVNVFVGTVVNVYSGIKQTNEVHIWVAQTFGATRLEILRRVAIPSAMPYIFTGLKVSLSMAWLGIVAAELLASTSGLGYMIQVSRSLGRADLVMVGMLTIGLIGAMLTVVLEALEKIFVRGNVK